MVITRTPFRVSFFGGGTDYPVYAEKHGGAVLSTTIDKYCYITARYMPPLFTYKYRVRYTDREETQTIGEIKHPSARECLFHLGFENDSIEIQHSSDLPAMGGLGSSSSFTVGLLNALSTLRGISKNKNELAKGAIYVEQKRIGENVGYQDQTAAAYGGFNRIDFLPSGEIKVMPISFDQKVINALEGRLLMTYVGQARIASQVAAEQIKNTPAKEQELSRMKAMVGDAIEILREGESRLDDFGEMLHEAWLLKRGLSSQITNSFIDEVYDKARRAGALGGKILGAGGGGFLLLFAGKGKEKSIREALEPLPFIPFHFENSGSSVIYHLPSEKYN